MRNSPLVRLVIMGMLFIGLLVPLAFVFGVVSDRTSRRDEAVHEVGAEWGSPQQFGGPLLAIPYQRTWRDEKGVVHERTALAFLLPEAIAIEGIVEPDTLWRGLFPVQVYTARLKISGHFARPDLSWIRPAPSSIDWAAATLDVGVSDPRGIARAVTLALGGRQVAALPGVTKSGLFRTGIQASIPIAPDPQAALPFAFDLDLRGTRDLRFLPIGNQTLVTLASAWPHPSFSGAPQERTVSAAGFSAAWRVPFFGRGFPARWTEDEVREEGSAQAPASAFGVALHQPVDIYRQTVRAVKYAPLFIVLTFVIAFLWEVTGKALVHPIQYLFAGFALCVFYLLLLSLSEHVGFDRAYAAAATATVALLSWYWTWVLLGRARGAVMFAALTALYGFLYLLLRLEDYALLAGSLGLFAMLALVMVLTRRVDWFNLRLTEPNA